MAKFNPIPFNHDNMTLSQVKKCVETLGMIFDGMEREVPVENIMFHANEARKQMLNQWSVIMMTKKFDLTKPVQTRDGRLPDLEAAFMEAVELIQRFSESERSQLPIGQAAAKIFLEKLK